MGTKTKTNDTDRAAKIADLHRRLEDAAAALATSDGWLAYLRAAARFHRYSPNNVLLIMCQRPDASHVAGFKAWLDLGRAVRKGEKGLAIFAPRPYAVGVGDDDGTEVERTGCAFALTHVFDVSQTDPIAGHPHPFAPSRRPSVAGDPTEARRLFAVLAADLTRSGVASGVDVEGDEHFPRPGVGGYYRIADRAIVVRAGDPVAMLGTLAHEAAHAVLDTPDKPAVSRAEEETIAQSAAHVVTTALGMDTERRSAEYVLSWTAGDAEAIRRGADLTRRAAERVLAALDAVPEAIAA